MANFLSTGISGLLAFQRAIDVTSHNIANVGTDGYSRQRAELTTRPAQPFGNGYVGSGVQVATTRRIYDDLLAQDVRTSSSSFNNLDAYATQMGKLDNLFSDTGTGLTATLQKFANAMHDLASNPASISARQVLLSEAQGLTERLKTYDSQLGTIDAQIETSMKSEADTVSSLADSLAKLNVQIAAAFSHGQPPNDLLDQRDRLIDDLSSHVDVSLVAQDDGEVNVFIGQGQALVVGSTASKLVLTTNPYDSARHGLAIAAGGAVPADVTNSLSGGTLGGILSFRTQVLDPTRNSLGRISVGLASVMNSQHRSGMDLNGNLGGDLFRVGGVDTLQSSLNTGSGSIAVTRSNLNALTEGDYTLQRTATGWSLRRADTGATVTLSGTGTVADPLTADGLSIVVSGTANTNDSFLIRPTRSATAGLGVLITDPARVAAAAPIRTSTGAANSGTGTISAGSVVDATNANLLSTVTIQFTGANTYSINGAGSFAYTSGSPITVNGWQAQISGAPAVGDQFVVSSNAGGTGDNRNAQALVDTLGTKVLDGGSSSLTDATNRLVGNVGVVTRQAQAGRDAQQVVHQEALDARDSLSGVNLDEEAANLVRYQQAYQAAAQLIAVAGTLFDTLLAATRK
jgi:flagellar hook-associated protein 1 FlgK